MPTKRTQEILNSFKNSFLDSSKVIHWNSVSLRGNTKKEHKKKMCNICIELSELGIQFATEVYLKNGRVADILIPTLATIVEVRNTETKEKFKKKNYSSDLRVVDISVHESTKKSMRKIL